MSKIKVKNFGPIKEGLEEDGGLIDVKKVTVFIGNQGSGKSTIAKLISTFMWLEKALYRGDINTISSEEFINEYCQYFRLNDYFRSNSEIYFSGDYIQFTFFDGKLEYNKVGIANVLDVSKIMYVPAERSFLSSVSKADEVSGLPKPLYTFQSEYERSLDELKEELSLPIGGYRLKYDLSARTSYILGDDYQLKLLDASSGLHSLIPLYVVSLNLALSIKNKEIDSSKAPLSFRQEQRKNAEISNLAIMAPQKNMSDEEIDRQIKIIESKYINSCFVNIVEEPEQNLFPASQHNILNSLVAYNNYLDSNKLILTTHSPYLINYITLAVKAFKVRRKLAEQEKNCDGEIDDIVSIDSLIDPDELVIYELDEKKGSISKLKSYKGVPSDENYLNESLAEVNRHFSRLQQIEKGWQ